MFVGRQRRLTLSLLSRTGSALLRRLLLDGAGGVALLFGLGTPVLVFAAAGAVDMAEVMRAKTSLQKAADSAAMTGAQQLAASTPSATKARTETSATELGLVLAPRWTTSADATADGANRSVRVDLTGTRASLFGTIMPAWTIKITATAALTSSRPLCVLALQGSGTQVLTLSGSAVMDAQACLVQSNADVQVQGTASLKAGSIRTVAAANGPMSPAPITDSPAIADPFATLNIAVPTTCNDTGGKTSGQGTITLNPGVHCGDMKISGHAQMVLNPGEHYFVNGQIEFKGQSSLVGSDVVAIFKGSSSISFSSKASMSLEGRKTGAYAGFVIVTDRSMTTPFSISTDSARLLHGTLYLPQASLQISGAANRVADQSPWTVVVAKQLQLTGSPDLMINAGYGSGVPVPSGVGSGGNARLTN